MHFDHRRLRVLLLATCALSLGSSVARAQTPGIVRDGSVGPDASAQPLPAALPGGASRIAIGEELGLRPGGGDTLLHSFSRFGIDANESAIFTANPARSTARIIARVTGDTRSDIFGTLGSDVPGADLYLLNPRGIFFGPGARLDVQGSFYASTAHELDFGNGERFEARAGGSVPRLAVPHPLAFRFTGDPAPITVDGTSLEVSNGSLGLVAGGIEIRGSGRPILARPLTELSVPLATILAVNDPTLDGLSIEQRVERIFSGPVPLSTEFFLSVSVGPFGPTQSVNPTLSAPNGSVDLISAGAGARAEFLFSDSAPAFLQLFGERRDINASGEVLLRASGTNNAGVFLRGRDLNLSSFRIDTGEPDSMPGPSQTVLDASGRISLLGGIRTGRDIAVVVTDSFGRPLVRSEQIDFSDAVRAALIGAPEGLSPSGLRGERVALQAASVLIGEGAFIRAGSSIGISALDTLELDSAVLSASQIRLAGGNIALRQTSLSSDFSDITGRSLYLESTDVRARNLSIHGNEIGILDGIINSGTSLVDTSPSRVSLVSRGSLWVVDSSLFGNRTAFAISGSAVELRESIVSGGAGVAISGVTLDIHNGQTMAIPLPGFLSSLDERILASPLSLRASKSIRVTSDFDLGGQLSSAGLPPDQAVGTALLGTTIHIEAPDVVLDGAVAGAFDGLASRVGDVFSDLGPRSEVRVSGERISILGGALDASSGFGNLGGLVSVSASESILLGRRDPAGPGSLVRALSFDASSAGEVSLSAPTIRLDGSVVSTAQFGGRLPFVPIRGDSRAGVVTFDAGRIEVVGGSIIDSSSFGSGASGQVNLRASESLLLSGAGTAVTARTSFSGAPGGISVQAPRVSILEGAIVTTEAAAPSAKDDPIFFPFAERFGSLFPEPMAVTGSAGDITVRTGTLEIKDGAIRSSSSGLGPAGSVTIDATERVAISNGSISTFAAQGATPDGSAGRRGDIAISAGKGIVLEDQSSITASVGAGLGGNVQLRTPGVVVLLDGSEVLAETAAGQGGEISIQATSFLKDPTSRVSADAGIGTNGIVSINSPEVDVDPGLSALIAEYASSAALLRSSCEASDRGGDASSLSVSTQRGLPISPDEMLLAFDGLRGEPPQVAAGPSPLAEPSASAQAAMAFRGGDFERSSRQFSEAAGAYAASGDVLRSAAVLHDQGQAQQALGEFTGSLATLQRALEGAERSGDAKLVASVLGSLGNTQLALGRDEAARGLLERGLALAERAGDASLAAVLQNNLGNHYASRGEYDAALEAYLRGAALAGEDAALQAKALANAGRAALDAGKLDVSGQLLDQARERLRSAPPSFERTLSSVHLGKSYTMLGRTGGRSPAALRTAHALLEDASRAARELGDVRLEAYALGALAEVYGADGRVDEALLLTRQGRKRAESAAATDLVYRSHWQEGRLLWAKGKASAAIAAYRRAVGLLEETRQESLARYGSRTTYFERALAPVYLDLADALLRGTELLEDVTPEARETLLREARATVEQLKAAELRDYFRDECAVKLEARTTSLDALSGQAKTAIVYAVPLADRTELLVSLPSGLARYTAAAGAAQLRDVARAFSYEVQRQGKVSYREPGRRLYDWLVAPYAGALEREGVQTLVFVPGPILRSLPMAALHDGKGFLIERYAVAVAPGLQLVDPKPLQREGAKLLLAGVSDAVQDLPALSFVGQELRAVRESFGGDGRVLLNDAFTSAAFDAALDDLRPSIVHVASHGIFNGDAQTSFLLTHADHLSMEQLARMIGRSRYRTERPLELLTLSGCRTAAGDDRAALGLAGIAVRSGARSAVGSLWQVGDQPAYELIVAFYDELKKPGTTKGDALRRAQLRMVQGEKFAHPFFWSPFLLVGNWL